MRWIWVLLLAGCQTVRLEPSRHLTRVDGVVAGSRVVVETEDGPVLAPPAGVEAAQVVARRACVAPAVPLVAGLVLSAAVTPIGFLVTRATQPHEDAAVPATTIALGVAGVGLVLGGLIWSFHCATLEDAPGEVQTRAPPSTIVVEHGGYRPARLLIDHQSDSVQVDQVRAWRVAAPGGTIDVYASPRMRARADEAVDTWVREAAERVAGSARWGPGVVLPGDPTMLMPERRLELDLVEAAPACRVEVRLEGTPTRSSTTACEAGNVRAALLREVEGLARSPRE